MIKVDYIIILILFVVVLLGLPIFFMYLILRKIFNRFKNLESRVDKLDKNIL